MECLWRFSRRVDRAYRVTSKSGRSKAPALVPSCDSGRIGKWCGPSGTTFPSRPAPGRENIRDFLEASTALSS
jgi:hypothetical protein